MLSWVRVPYYFCYFTIYTLSNIRIVSISFFLITNMPKIKYIIYLGLSIYKFWIKFYYANLIEVLKKVITFRLTLDFSDFESVCFEKHVNFFLFLIKKICTSMLHMPFANNTGPGSRGDGAHCGHGSKLPRQLLQMWGRIKGLL